METLDLKERATVDVRKTELVENHNNYIERHPELRELLNDFISSVLLNKPDDIFRFTREFFSKFNPEPIKNKPLLLVGPSGVGKSTLIKHLMDTFPGVFEFSVSTTTRRPRPGEQHGVHYYYVSVEEFEEKVRQGQFLEHATVHNNMYGTSKQAVLEIFERGKICVMDVDVQGTIKIYEAGLDFNCLFVMPKSMKQLEERLKARGTEDSNVLRTRLRNAQAEIETAKANKHIFKSYLVNDEYEETIRDLMDYIYRYYEHLKNF
jgi:guanylate kinase